MWDVRPLTDEELYELSVDVRLDFDNLSVVLGFNTKEWYWYSDTLEAYLDTGFSYREDCGMVYGITKANLLNPNNEWIFGDVDL